MEGDSSFFGYAIVGLLTLIFLAAIIFPFFDAFKKSSIEGTYDEACNTFIRQHIMGNKLFEARDDNFPCKTKEITITESNKYDIMREVSIPMLKCGKTYEFGTYELFSGKANQKTTFCGVCSTINFTKKDILLNQKEFTDFQFNYKVGKSSQSIADMLSPVATSPYYQSIGEADKNQLMGNLALNTSKSYYVVFRYDKKEGYGIIESLIHKVGMGMAIGGAVGLAGTAIFLSGGTALFVVGPVISSGVVVGGTFGYAYYSLTEENDKPQWSSSVFLVEKSPGSLQSLECQNIVGIQEPGITSRLYTS